MSAHDSLFHIAGQTAVVTGGSGGLGRTLARALAQAGAQVAVLGRRREACEDVVAEIQARGGRALAVTADVCDRSELEQAAQVITQTFGAAQILINGAGGNDPAATTTPAQSFFDLAPEAVTRVVDTNFKGTFIACQVFGKRMVAQGARGCIVNITSMAALRPLTRVAAYGAAKAATGNFTQWLAVHMAQVYGPGIRVNAIAPGFFLTEQNRFLLTDAQTGELTPRGQSIIAHTPMGRLGLAEDLVGTLLWLVSPAAAYVTGIVVPVDGGFSAYSGV